MMPGPLARSARWVWRSRSAGAWLARTALLPAAGVFSIGTALRNRLYDSGRRASEPLPVPSLGIGNLAVGGTGKTPLAAWAARELARRGLRAGIVLRGYGGDEVAEHRAANRDAVVEAGADRRVAAARAIVRGAEVLVLDDCLQHRAVRADVMLAAVSAETWSGARWPLPAGPWREGPGALARADAVVVTRKVARKDDAASLAARLAPLTRGGTGIVAALEPAALVRAGGRSEAPTSLYGREVLVVAGVAEPQLLAEQLRGMGAYVRLLDLGDHHGYRAGEGASLAGRVPPGGLAVTTAKDAVKLAPLWPASAAPLLVATLQVAIESGASALEQLLDRVATAARQQGTRGAAAASPARPS